MKMKNLIAASVAALLVSATAAKAADIVHYQEPEFKPAFSWTGLYGGGQIGWGWGDADTKVKEKGKGKLGKKSLSPDGFMGGFYAGYNFQFSDAIILGVDTDFIFSDQSDSSVKTGIGKMAVRQKWNGATRARIGYAWDRLLPYFAAGVSYADIKSKYSGEYGDVSASSSRVGWNVGAGIDYAMTDHIILRGEYRFTDFGDKTPKFDGDYKYKSEYNQNDIRIGVAYKF